jgi:DNA-binding CsgD family transcriptional regulator
VRGSIISGGGLVFSTDDLAQKLAACRNFTEICQLATSFPLTDTSLITGAMLASIDADARIRELGRYGILGTGPSKHSAALSSDGLIAQAMQKTEPTLLTDLQADARSSLLTPDSDIDEIVRLNQFQSCYVIPLFDQNYLYGVLGLLSDKPIAVKPTMLFEDKTFQALFSMAVRAVAFRNPEKPNNQQTLMADLTIREQTILALLAQDRSNQEIALELNTSVSTVKAAVSEILKKLEVDSRKQAGIKARYSGLA